MRDKKSLISLLKYVFKGNQLVYLEYPVSGETKYFPSKGIPFFEQLFSQFFQNLINFSKVLDNNLNELSTISFDKKDDSSPFWKNSTLSALDGASLYSIVRNYKPKNIIEIGSGNSTKFISKAVKKNFEEDHFSSELISIDPNPRTFVDSLCNKIYRNSLENISLDIFDKLVEGDFIFFDGSHRCFQNNDVSIFFLEILPKLKKGVLVGIHDIWLPYDYPQDWVQRFYNEQIVLGAYMLGRKDNIDILVANMYSSKTDTLRSQYQTILNNLNIDKDEKFRDGGLLVFKS